MTGPCASWPILRNRVWAERAVLFGVLTQAWQVLTGPITLWLITRRLSPDAQGYYFSFGSILGFQVFFEMGFSTTILYITSHEWAHLNLDGGGRLTGDLRAMARLGSIARLVMKWYALASGLLILGVGVGGYVFLHSSSHYDIPWEGPWLGVVVTTGLMFWTAPFVVMLDGCNQMAVTNQFRFAQAVLNSLVLWLVLIFGGGLWAVLASAGTRLICYLYILLIRYGRLFRSLLRARTTKHQVSWRSEIWPLQWRTALTAIVAYCGANLFVPIMFRYHGAAAAGRMGLTLSLVAMVQSGTLVWLGTRAPGFGIFIARRQYAELDRSFLKACVISLAIFVVGGSVLAGITSLLYHMGSPLAHRLLPPGPTLLLLGANIFSVVATCESVYLLAHKRMPLAVLLPPVAAYGGASVLICVLGGRLGPTGAAGGYLAMMAVLALWETAVWHRCRLSWHADVVT